uniref:Diphthine--ammonia ligase n=1 Tax=Steinernema glaseri TaxID=37863 RepID=A0A1I8AS10_9BILA
MKCVADGHEIVCLGNLHPSQGLQEIDSYMYQSVGHDGVGYYAEAFGLPLYRQEITGKPLNVGSDYDVTNDDEVEDLFVLLKRIVQEHPDVEAVSAGAILSSYQKVRVEHVCARLGLKPLCYLWERNQQELLDEMITAGVHAVLIKVAAMGLSDKHLGLSLAEARPTLQKLSDNYGVHVCGEGGEYESFVVDCPLFKKRISIDESEVVAHSEDPFAPVYYLKLVTLSLHNK